MKKSSRAPQSSGFGFAAVFRRGDPAQRLRGLRNLFWLAWVWAVLLAAGGLMAAVAGRNLPPETMAMLCVAVLVAAACGALVVEGALRAVMVPRAGPSRKASSRTRRKLAGASTQEHRALKPDQIAESSALAGPVDPEPSSGGDEAELEPAQEHAASLGEAAKAPSVRKLSRRRGRAG